MESFYTYTYTYTYSNARLLDSDGDSDPELPEGDQGRSPLRRQRFLV